MVQLYLLVKLMLRLKLNLDRSRRKHFQRLYWLSVPVSYILLRSAKVHVMRGKRLKIFERESFANKLYLKKQYVRSQMKVGTSIASHLKYMKELADKLAAI